MASFKRFVDVKVCYHLKKHKNYKWRVLQWDFDKLVSLLWSAPVFVTQCLPRFLHFLPDLGLHDYHKKIVKHYELLMLVFINYANHFVFFLVWYYY